MRKPTGSSEAARESQLLEEAQIDASDLQSRFESASFHFARRV